MFPPNYHEIVRVFPVRNRAVLFTYGAIIYNPAGFKVPPELIEHEKVHIAQQADVDPAAWWRLYLTNANFRLGVEIPAHKAEAEWLRSNGRKWEHVARRLASPLYGSVISEDEAVELLRDYTYDSDEAKQVAENIQDILEQQSQSVER